MLFNSDVFLRFFAAFLLLYYLVRGHRAWRNVLIVGASYLFYGWWDYRFLSLLFLSSVVDYSVGRKLAVTEDPARRKLWLGLSLVVSLGLLGFFKYCNFFVESFAAVLAQLGLSASPPVLNVVLPVGISFYTFQSMSYAIDVYRRRLPATRSFVEFLAFVSFFPQLVAGPIERASNLLPQFQRPRVITSAMVGEGVWLMLWGMFKKVVLADNLAPLVEQAYHPGVHSGPVIVLGTIAFAFQIYGDFSGYSDIARGLAKILGFELMVNFNLPYGASSLREFWHRWHVSLSTWLRDYLYVSLGGNRRGAVRTRLNLLVTMVLGGLWHGAAWNFVLWGLWHGAGLAVTRRDRRVAGTAPLPGWRRGIAWGLTAAFVLYGWLLFRAGSFSEVVRLTTSLGRLEWPVWIGSYALNLVVFSLPLVLVQIWQARAGDLLAPARLPLVPRALLQGALLGAVILYWEKQASPFIYFQF